MHRGDEDKAPEQVGGLRVFKAKIKGHVEEEGRVKKN